MKHVTRGTLLLGTLSALVLSACSFSNVPETYKNTRALPRNEVEVSGFSHNLTFGPGNELSAGEQAALADFLYANQVGYGDELVLDFAVNDAAWSAKMSAVKTFLKARGYWVKYASQSGSVTNQSQAVLNINRYSVVSPDCQALSQASFTKGELYEDKIFGCVNAYNFGLMVANPQDLITGQPDLGPSTYGSVRAIQLFRARMATDRYKFDTRTKNDIIFTGEGAVTEEEK